MMSVLKSVQYSQSETSVSFDEGLHRYVIRTFSAMDKQAGNSVSSSTFKVGQHEFQVVCYPGGETKEVDEYLSLFLGYKGPNHQCTATWTLKCVNQINPQKSRERVWAKGDRYNTFTKGKHYDRFYKMVYCCLAKLYLNI